MQEESQPIKAYNSILSFDNSKQALRKKGLVEDTFNLLEKGANVFFDLFLCLYGGLTPKVIEQKLLAAKDKSDLKITCAVFWFKVMPKNVESAKFFIAKENLRERFKSYYGEDCSELVLQYLNANIDTEKYNWIDCRKMYENCFEGIDFSNDLEIMVREGYLPLKGGKINAWNATSNIFGKGEKENRPLKVENYNKILSALNKNDIQDFGTFEKNVFSSIGAKNYKEFRKNIGNNGRN